MAKAKAPPQDYWATTEPLYQYHDIPGSNPFQQDRAVGSAVSVMAARVWMPGYFYWAPAIPANPQRMLQRNDLTLYMPPPVPHSGSVNEPMYGYPRQNNQSDIPYIMLKAPRF